MNADIVLSPDPDDETIDLRSPSEDPHVITRPLVHCPECGAGGLEPVAEGETVNFTCNACGRTWHVELGYVRLVAPGSEI